MNSLSIDILGLASAKMPEIRAPEGVAGMFASLVAGIGDTSGDVAGAAVPGVVLPDARQDLAAGVSTASLMAATAAVPVTAAGTTPVIAPPSPLAAPAPPDAPLSDMAAALSIAPADDAAPAASDPQQVGVCTVVVTPRFRPAPPAADGDDAEVTENEHLPARDAPLPADAGEDRAADAVVVMLQPRKGLPVGATQVSPDKPAGKPVAGTPPQPGQCEVVIPRFKPAEQAPAVCETDVPLLPAADDQQPEDDAGDTPAPADEAPSAAPPPAPVPILVPVAAPVASGAPVVGAPIEPVQTDADAPVAGVDADASRKPSLAPAGSDQAPAQPQAAAPAKPAIVLPVIPAAQPDAATLQAVAALVQSFSEDRRSAASTDNSQSAALGAVTAAAATTAAPHRVEAPVAAQSAPVIDTRRAEWMEALIDRIDEQRGHNGRSVHIALSPDALGGVEVKLRQDGDRVHIAFTTDTAQARALLNEAAPRLAQLADSRGLKLGDTGVEQQGRQDRGTADQQAAAPDAPASAFSDSTSEDAADAADRIA